MEILFTQPDCARPTTHNALNRAVGRSVLGWFMASQSIPSWNQIIAWLKEMEALRTIAA